MPDVVGTWTTDANLTSEETEYYRPRLAQIAEQVTVLERVAEGLYVTHVILILMGPDQEHHVEWTLRLRVTGPVS